MHENDVRRIIKDLEKRYSKKHNEGAKFNFIQKSLSGIRVSVWIRNLMVLTLLSLFLFIVYSFVQYLG